MINGLGESELKCVLCAIVLVIGVALWLLYDWARR